MWIIVLWVSWSRGTAWEDSCCLSRGRFTGVKGHFKLNIMRSTEGETAWKTESIMVSVAMEDVSPPLSNLPSLCHPHSPPLTSLENPKGRDTQWMDPCQLICQLCAIKQGGMTQHADDFTRVVRDEPINCNKEVTLQKVEEPADEEVPHMQINAVSSPCTCMGSGVMIARGKVWYYFSDIVLSRLMIQSHHASGRIGMTVGCKSMQSEVHHNSMQSLPYKEYELPWTLLCSAYLWYDAKVCFTHIVPISCTNCLQAQHNLSLPYVSCPNIYMEGIPTYIQPFCARQRELIPPHPWHQWSHPSTWHSLSLTSPRIRSASSAGVECHPLDCQMSTPILRSSQHEIDNAKVKGLG